MICAGLLSLTGASALTFHGYSAGPELALLGFISSLFVAILWLRDVSAEGTACGYHTFAVQRGLHMGFLLFLISEIFVFVSVFWAYFHVALAPSIELGGHWPPTGIAAVDYLGLPLANTVLLLSSGATVTYAHHAIMAGKDRRGAIVGLALTVILAVIFMGIQGFEYVESAFTIADGAFGTTFFASTRLHFFHVLLGTIFLSVGLYRMIAYHFTTHHAVGLEAGILYWHMVDVVWLFLYVAVYWWAA